MKKSLLIFICIFVVTLNAKSYKSIVQPYETITISSEVNGKIVFLDKSKELSNFTGNIVSIDTSLDEVKLKNLKSKYSILKEQLSIKENNYKSILKIRAKGQIEKDNYKVDVLNLKSQLTDIDSSIETLKDTISKKRIYVDNLYIREFLVSQGEVVFAGTKLFIAENQQKSKIIIYATKSDIDDIRSKIILINGNNDHGYKISKVSNNTDSTYISTYKVELTNDMKPEQFGQVVDIEIK
jgi:hypothetical protein